MECDAVQFGIHIPQKDDQSRVVGVSGAVRRLLGFYWKERHTVVLLHRLKTKISSSVRKCVQCENAFRMDSSKLVDHREILRQ